MIYTIPPNDLRVGNLLYDILGRIVTVSEIKTSGVRCLYNGQPITDLPGITSSLFPYNAVSPITLTDAILSNCGFAFDDGFYRLYVSPFMIMDLSPVDSCYSVELTDGTSDSIIGPPLFYLHNLQNLHYFLSRKELIYTPEL